MEEERDEVGWIGARKIRRELDRRERVMRCRGRDDSISAPINSPSPHLPQRNTAQDQVINFLKDNYSPV